MRDLTSIKSWSQRSGWNHNWIEGAKNNHSIPCRHHLPSNLWRSHLCVTEYLTPNPKKVHSESDVAHEVIVCSNLFLLFSGSRSLCPVVIVLVPRLKGLLNADLMLVLNKENGLYLRYWHQSIQVKGSYNHSKTRVCNHKIPKPKLVNRKI